MHGGQTRQLCPIFAQSAKYATSHQETFRQTHVEGHFTKLTYPLQNCAQQHYFQQPKGGAPPPAGPPSSLQPLGGWWVLPAMERCLQISAFPLLVSTRGSVRILERTVSSQPQGGT